MDQESGQGSAWWFFCSTWCELKVIRGIHLVNDTSGPRQSPQCSAGCGDEGRLGLVGAVFWVPLACAGGESGSFQKPRAPRGRVPNLLECDFCPENQNAALIRCFPRLPPAPKVAYFNSISEWLYSAINPFFNSESRGLLGTADTL